MVKKVHVSLSILVAILTPHIRFVLMILYESHWHELSTNPIVEASNLLESYDDSNNESSLVHWANISVRYQTILDALLYVWNTVFYVWLYDI